MGYLEGKVSIQISAPGSFKELRRNLSGFTLVEILLVLLIVGILASAVLPTLSQRQSSPREEAERLALVIEHAQVMAASFGAPIGLSVASDQYQFLQWTGSWTALEYESTLLPHPVPPGISLDLIPENNISGIIRLSPTGFPPAFKIRVSGKNATWVVKGNPVGRITVENTELP